MGPRVRGDDNCFCGSVNAMSPHLRAGVIAAAAVLVLDQASKLWLLFVFDIGRRGAVKVTPFFDLVLAWNVGISFGWFQNDGFLAQAVLTVIKAVAVIVLAVWMARSRNRLATVALGLIIGGAIGNAIDRFAYGAVVDFALFHIQIASTTTAMALIAVSTAWARKPSFWNQPKLIPTFQASSRSKNGVIFTLPRCARSNTNSSHSFEAWSSTSVTIPVMKPARR